MPDAAPPPNPEDRPLSLKWHRHREGVASLWLHGFTGAPESWTEVAAEHPGPIATLALPGHCGNAVLDADFDANVAAMAAVIRRGIDTPIRLVGYSMGARLALALALDHAALFCDLTLIGVHPGLADPAARAERRAADRRWIDLLVGSGIAAFVDAWQAQPMWASQDRVAPAALARQHAVRMSHDPLGLAAALSALGLGQMPCYRPRLGELAMPTRLLVGARDHKFVALAHDLGRELPRLEVTVVPSAGHNLLLETPQVLAAALA